LKPTSATKCISNFPCRGKKGITKGSANEICEWHQLYTVQQEKTIKQQYSCSSELELIYLCTVHKLIVWSFNSLSDKAGPRELTHLLLYSHLSEKTVLVTIIPSMPKAAGFTIYLYNYFIKHCISFILGALSFSFYFATVTFSQAIYMYRVVNS